jgi:predicted RecB family nuclease
MSWKNSNSAIEENSEENYELQLKYAEGNEIGEKARETFHDGILIDVHNIDNAVEETKNAISDKHASIIFEAAFITEDLIARPDILIREKNNTFELIEVKSSLNDKEELWDDIAYTGMVLQLSGININKYTLMLMSKEFRLGMTDEKMFVKFDHTDEVINKINDMRSIKDSIVSSLKSKVEPANPLSLACRGCDYLDICFPDYAKKDSIFNLPRISEKLFNDLTSQGIKSIGNIPDTYKLSDTQAFVRESVKKDKIIITNKLRTMLDEIEWPIYYLDFESIMTAVPLFPNTAPYTQIPTQFSIHYLEKPNAKTDHFEYLANTNRDCRDELADKLISYLGIKGTVFSYSSFEKTIINGLIGQFPNKKESLKMIIDRISDLENIVKCTYHPEYAGSYSIKKTLPALVPSLNYSDLDIHNGGMAMSVFALMVKGLIDPNKEIDIRISLLKYCERDTLAMVKLHQVLMQL